MPRRVGQSGQARARNATNPFHYNEEAAYNVRSLAGRALGNETRYGLLRCLVDEPGLSQRELAEKFSISLSQTNYCLKAVLNKGYIKAVNFKNSNHKRAYMYELTVAGITAKSRATARFLARKCVEYGGGNRRAASGGVNPCRKRPQSFSSRRDDIKRALRVFYGRRCWQVEHRGRYSFWWPCEARFLPRQ